MYHCGMRQMEERHVPNQVDLMVWSNRLDLLAISNFKGEVQVHRLHWQKVWNLPPPKENVSVQAMSWRPDGKALAIGYNSGSVFIVDIEDKEMLDRYELENDNMGEFESKHTGISCIKWAVRAGTIESATDYNFYDDSSKLLQKPPSSSGYKNQGNDDVVKELKDVHEPNQLNMLLVGYDTGYLYLSIFGRYSFGTLYLPKVFHDDCGEYKILDFTLTDDFSLLQVIYLNLPRNTVYSTLINTDVLSAYAEEMFVVANRYCLVIQLLTHLDQTMISITEAWEHILLEMDTKMSYYAASVPEGGVSADLLELLMLGMPSDELELFLLQELTAKGLKKFGSSVELSYSTIQKLVLKQLNIVGQNLTYQLAELRGLTRIPDRYMITGLDDISIGEAIKACCAFLNKCLELQQVIDLSMRNYKAFFRWLFVVIVRLLDEPTPSEIVKITQQELTHIAEFLYNFDNVQVENSEKSQEKPVKFNLERLGQYLQDQDLTILSDDEDNPWHKFLKDNSCLLKDNDTIFSMSEFRKFSLLQQHKFLKNAIDRVFDISDKDVSKYFTVINNIPCYENPPNSTLSDLRVSQIFDSGNQQFLSAIVNTADSEKFCFLCMNVKDKNYHATATKYYFSPNLVQDSPKNQISNEYVPVLDLQFYSSEYLSVLIKNPQQAGSTIFIQLPMKIAVDNANDFIIKKRTCVFDNKMSRRDLSPLLDQGVMKYLDKMDGFRIAVTGGRKVAVVLSHSRRKVRVYEMEIDGEDDEDETFNTTHSRSEYSQGAGDKQNITTEDVNF